MAEERAEQRWIIKVNNAEQMSVRPGMSLEIGRKPIRPLAGDGVPRMEIVDKTRSMSKKHARFRVNDQGLASIVDLNSTNGSYLVRPDGGLLRLKPGDEVSLPGSPARIQFGDVPVDFIRVEEPEHGIRREVSDLFTYAARGGKQEPELGEMSVDDILDLRAGEPTTVFDARNVSERIKGLQPAPGASSVVGAPADQTPAAGEQKQAGQSLLTPDSGQVEQEASESSQHPVESISLNIVQPDRLEEAEPRDLFRDALNGGVESGGETTPPQTADRQAMGGTAAEANPTVGTGTVDTGADASQGVASPPVQQPAPQEPGRAAVPVSMPLPQKLEEYGNAQSDLPEADLGAAETSSQTGSIGGSSGLAQDYQPVFEAGSVFERVSRGDFDQHREQVEVDGFTDDQARKSTDFADQFAMAQHQELLPFLAMNPSLYDDLYAWLSAQGNEDIDAALSKNAGYEEYRKAVGK
ncbi:hypothetical protein CRD60_06295 [Bifidobacterium aemilianum]|uniref:FHA domain-containing protein n=1 Tax=Bifidobacterium aemilianum TaxID=2493120 RepID=A0A366K783_9BIFI|nr:FHA domain-containing protein [Bifidobacterium aemilianum]RBP97596.1 hypothetical protein CRD60_06295 [Bifidobacterium aemilianum]